MFTLENQYIELTIKAEFSVANLNKASKLKPKYSWDNRLIGFYDETGNSYSLIVALEVNEGVDKIIWKESEFEENLGLSLTNYTQADFSEIICQQY